MEIKSPPHPFLFFLNDQHWLSSDVQCKETEESRGMRLENKAKVMCSIMLVFVHVATRDKYSLHLSYRLQKLNQ